MTEGMINHPNFGNNDAANVSICEEFNRCQKKRILSKTTMLTNVGFPILKAARTKTRIGDSIRLELAEYILYLPERYNCLRDDTIRQLNGGGYMIFKKSEDDNFILRISKNI